mgnify:CR=1 FL=1
MYNILIIGSNSNIAKNFSEFFIKKKKVKKVFGLDIQTKSNFKSKKFKYFKINLDKKKYKIVKIANKIDIVFIFSFELNFRKKNKSEYFSKGKNLIHNCIKIVNFHNIKKVVYMSSVAVYGNQNTIFTEQTKIKPNTNYGKLKVLSENYVKKNSEGKYNYLIFRLTQIYGKNVKSSWVYKFFNDVKNKKMISIFGNGKQKRDLLHVNDLCSLAYKIINFKDNNIFNVCSKKAYSLNYIMKLIKAKYVYVKSPNNKKTEVENIISTNKKVKKFFNWNIKKKIHKEILKF